MTTAIRRWATWLVVVLAGIAVPACSRDSGNTDAGRLARARPIVQRMSDLLAAANAITVTVHEVRDQVRPDGRTEQITITRETTIQRPNKLYFRSSGDVANEGWYDGARLLIVAHKDKVFAQAAMPETLDRTLDAIQERYGLPIPAADLLYANPAHALIADSTRGGWVGQEQVGQQLCDQLAFQDRGVTWSIWIAAAGQPLPSRMVVEFPERRRIKKVDAAFDAWTLTPVIDAQRFVAVVPPGYEGVAMIQRAAILGDQAQTAAPPADRK